MMFKVAVITAVMAFSVISGSVGGVEARAEGTKNSALQISSSGTAGGWTDYNTSITKEAKSVFEEALKGMVGVSYTPLAYATQVVAGTNYQFFCNSKVVSPGASNHPVIIHIFAPLPRQGKPHITAINQITQ
jgi:hypothetical protein